MYLQFSLYRYKEQNIKSSDSYKSYSKQIPKFLHNRPKYVVSHIIQRMESAIPSKNIKMETTKHFTITSSSSTYQVFLGSNDQMPSCQCLDYRSRKMPCKHICAVVQQPNVGWESIGVKFSNHPLFTLDPHIIQPKANISPTQTDIKHKSLPGNFAQCPNYEKAHSSDCFLTTTDYCSNSIQNVRNKCVQKVKQIQDELYILDDEKVLDKTLEMLQEVIQYTRKNHPEENGISLKNKSLSPKKKQISKCRSQSALPKRKCKRCPGKRVGRAADLESEKIEVFEESLKKKRSTKNANYK